MSLHVPSSSVDKTSSIAGKVTPAASRPGSLSVTGLV
jgi:hypothetical protein